MNREQDGWIAIVAALILLLSRQRAAEGLGFLGIILDRDRNRADNGDRDIGTAGAPVRILVIASREDLQIAREVRRILKAGPPAP